MKQESPPAAQRWSFYLCAGAAVVMLLALLRSRIHAGMVIASGSERLVDVTRDPRGETNVSREFPDGLERFRRWTAIYSGVYPWVVESGRSGLPPRSGGFPE